MPGSRDTRLWRHHRWWCQPLRLYQRCVFIQYRQHSQHFAYMSTWGRNIQYSLVASSSPFRWPWALDRWPPHQSHLWPNIDKWHEGCASIFSVIRSLGESSLAVWPWDLAEGHLLQNRHTGKLPMWRQLICALALVLTFAYVVTCAHEVTSPYSSITSIVLCR